MGKEHGILTSRDIGEEYRIFLNQGKKKTWLAWRMQKLKDH